MNRFISEQADAWSQVRRLYEDSKFFATFMGTPPLETPDGPGATVASTARLREWLPGILTKYGITSMLDGACGDWNWMRLVDLGDIAVTGWDVDEGRVQRCRVNAPSRRFECVNLLTVDDIPYFDLILLRHVCQHLPTNELVEYVLAKFRASGSRYLLTTTFPGADNTFEFDPYGSEHAWRGYFERPYDLLAPPFSLGPPLEVFAENLGPGGILTVSHDLALFKLA